MLIFSSPHPTSSPRKHLTLNHFLVGMPRSDWTWCTIIRYNDRTNHNDNQNRRDRNAGTFSRCVLSLFCCPCQEASSVVLELALPPTQKALSHSPWRRVNAVSQWLRSHAAMRQARVAKSSESSAPGRFLPVRHRARKSESRFSPSPIRAVTVFVPFGTRPPPVLLKGRVS